MEIYDKIPFEITIGSNGDCHDRYLIRIFEMKESLKIIEYCINDISFRIIKIKDNKITPPLRKEIKHSMKSINSSF
jgi:NADH:ubiquinone oxidoreductase subunit D